MRATLHNFGLTRLDASQIRPAGSVATTSTGPAASAVKPQSAGLAPQYFPTYANPFQDRAFTPTVRKVMFQATQAKPPTMVVRALQYAVSAEVCDAVIAAVEGAQAAFSHFGWVRSNHVHSQEEREAAALVDAANRREGMTAEEVAHDKALWGDQGFGGLFIETFKSKKYGEHTYQFTIDAPWSTFKAGDSPDKIARAQELQRQKDEVVAYLRERLAEHGIGVLEAGDAILIGSAKFTKREAAQEICANIAAQKHEVVCLGDKPQDGGNDRHLYAEADLPHGVHSNAYNVGSNDPADPRVDNTHKGQHARGSVAVLVEKMVDNLVARASGRPVPHKTFIIDFDGTLNMPHTHGVDPEALAALMLLMEHDMGFTIATGRGPALYPLVLDQMIAEGVPGSTIAKYFGMYLFNGTRPVEPEEIAEIVAERSKGTLHPVGRLDGKSVGQLLVGLRAQVQQAVAERTAKSAS